MNISVPDALAAEVRARGLPVSAICQRALSAEISEPPGTWHGWLLTLNCGHLELTDLPDRQPGQLTTCDMCPLTVHSPESPGLPSRQVRLIVDRRSAQVPGQPAGMDPAYWYGT